MWRATPYIIVVALWCAPSLGVAAPYLPRHDNQILEHLPARLNGPTARELREQRAELARDPSNMARAAGLARRYIEQGRSTADPRYLSYAQAALGPWWELKDPAPEILVLRAVIRQSNHDFSGALTDLNAALEKQPGNAQAWLSRAMLLQVQSDYGEARRSCQALQRIAERMSALAATAIICASSIDSFSGRALSAYAALKDIAASRQSLAAEERVWALSILADIAARIGRAEEAEHYFKRALTSTPDDNFLLAAYSDFLLDQGRAAEVIALLTQESKSDGLLLRAALAEQAVGGAKLREYIDTLGKRFSASRLRNDSRHLREEARYTLHLLHQPRAALQLAQANWRVQREPEDARILLESAWSAHDTRAAQPVLAWLQRTGIEDERLAQLRERFDGAPT